MNKKDLLKNIAESAYNIGFGAKVHFSTFDIVDKIPGFIGFLSLSIGILALFIPIFSAKLLSGSLIILGIISLLIDRYSK
ncbi:SLATT domain-containing protein [Leptospira selangorensis]|uniref:SLATT domain-containing protein n=1 Tax=Leptospira selangorensis TaxID=2484982 RepID=A0ABY2NGH6_9LEPT|nr:SLATT domain-containing protein [Leptospira selangorensis]